MEVREHEPLGPKTTMRIGGTARYFAVLRTREDAEDAAAFAREHGVPLIVLGGGSNTVFADGEINALVVRIAADAVRIEGNTVSVEAGKNLAMLINELAAHDLDLSPLTGILGTVGGALFGNAGQGPDGVWIDSVVRRVTAYVDGTWREYDREACNFSYRESLFKGMSPAPILWEAQFHVPSRPSPEVKAEVERLLMRRIETQPHVKTAGSCFKAQDGTPAWKLIDKAGLRGESIGGVQVAQKHANFLLNTGNARFDDAVMLVERIRHDVGDLGVEMRFVREDGSLAF